MNVIISTRRCSPSNSLRAEAVDRIRRLSRFEPRLSEAEVTFDTDHGEHQVEVRLSVAGRRSVVAHANADSFEDALNRTVDRLGRQLKRRREQHRDHQAEKLSKVISARAGGD